MNHLIAANSLPVLSNDSLDAYLRNIASIPVLTEAEEYALAQEYQKTKSIKAAQHLVLSNLKFVAHIVRGYSGYGLSQVDLIQEGNIGLMKAIKKFDLKYKVRLISFAVHWIKAEIHEFVIRNWRIVKIATTKEQRKLFFNLRKNKNRLGFVNQQEITEISQKLNVSKKSVAEMDKRMSLPECGFDLPEGNENSFSPSDYLEASNANPEQILSTNEVDNQKLIVKSLASLDNRSREIIQQRWLKEPKATLHELAAHFKISAERVRQIEKVAMQKMKSVLE